MFFFVLDAENIHRDLVTSSLLQVNTDISRYPVFQPVCMRSVHKLVVFICLSGSPCTILTLRFRARRS